MGRNKDNDKAYQHKYYKEHVGEKHYDSLRKEAKARYESKPSVKKRRNKRLRDKWANDPEFRARRYEAQRKYLAKKRKMSMAARMHKQILSAPARG